MQSSNPEAKAEILSRSPYLRAFLNMPYAATSDHIIAVLESYREKFMAGSENRGLVVATLATAYTSAGMFRGSIGLDVAGIHTAYGLMAGHALEKEINIPPLLEDIAKSFTRVDTLEPDFAKGLYTADSRQRILLEGLLRNGIQIREAEFNLRPDVEEFIRSLSL